MNYKHKGLLLFTSIVFLYATFVSLGCITPSPVIIVAISIASWFLSLGDFCVSQTCTLQEEVFAQLDATDSAAKTVISIGNLAIKRQKQLILSMGNANELAYYTELEKQIEIQEHQIERKNKQLQNAVKSNIRNRKLGKTLKLLGYVTFVLIVAFARNVNTENSSLDILTVWAFFIMLLGYLLGLLLISQKNKQTKESKDALLALGTMEAELKAEVTRNAR